MCAGSQAFAVSLLSCSILLLTTVFYVGSALVGKKMKLNILQYARADSLRRGRGRTQVLVYSSLRHRHPLNSDTLGRAPFRCEHCRG